MGDQIYNIDEYRREAESLYRELRSGRGAAKLRAAKRFQILDAWRHVPAKQIHEEADAIPIEEARQVVARENAFADWTELAEATADVPIAFHTARLFPEKSDVFLNLWYRNYEEARSAHEAEPDLLLFPYQEQFVLCEPALIGWLGGDPHDPDWEKIGRDWAQPKDEDARARLAARLHKALP